MQNSILNRICDDLAIPEELVKQALESAHTRYRKISVPKRAGGYRTILQPTVELKLIHRWLLQNILSYLPISSVATAFYAGSSIVKNATTHKDSIYSVRVDLSNFFNSIQSEDLNKIIISTQHELPNWAKAPEVCTLIQKACFDRQYRLPIGYPSSPCIANAVMYDIDNKLFEIINRESNRFGSAALTRYADDFIFSTDKRGACYAFTDMLSELLSKTSSPKLKINESKTRYMSRPGGSVLVTGLRINQEGEVRVHPSYRDHVRLLLKLYSTEKLKAEDCQKLRGHLAFIEHADPCLFTRFSKRYYKEIALLRRY